MPLTASDTVCPESGLPWGSLTATVIVADALPSAVTPLVGLTVTVETDALTAPGATTRLELATPIREPSVAVRVVVSARRNVVASTLEDCPLVKVTEVVKLGADPSGARPGPL